MIIFGEYMYYGFGSTKLTALHNFFIDLPRDGHPGRITIDRGKLRQHISYIHIYHCTKNTLE